MSQNMVIQLNPVNADKQFLSIASDGTWSSPGGWIAAGRYPKVAKDGVSDLLLFDMNGLKRLRLKDAGLAMTMPAGGRFEEVRDSPDSGAINGTWTLSSVSE